MSTHLLALVFLAMSMVGCAETPRRLQKEEAALNTGGSITRLFHSALYYPFELSPRFDGYLVGIEKVHRPEGGFNVKNRIEYGLKDSALQSKFDDGKMMVVTHVIQHFADWRRSSNCTLFNAYVQSVDSVARQLVPMCDQTTIPVFRKPEEAIHNSWEALDLLSADIKRRISSPMMPEAKTNSSNPVPPPENGPAYTHIVVVVLGWNTAQDEAVRNINSIVWNMQRAHRERSNPSGSQLPPASRFNFNPLVVGVTWPSQWTNDWLDPLVKLVSFPTKAGDADEVGMSWLGALLHDTLPKAQTIDKLPVIVIGHSFGAKASSVAACAGPAIVRSPTSSPLPLSKIDLIVNLQPAYLAERVFGRSSWLQNVVYPTGCPNATRFVLTASSGDKAVPLPFWGTYLGEIKSYRKFCSADSPGPRIAQCAVARVDGSVEITQPTDSRIYYVDASDLISENAYGTGGGSHSDIYRLEHGRFMYNMILGTLAERFTK